MKKLVMIAAALLLGTATIATTTALAQQSNEIRTQQDLFTPQNRMNQNRLNARRPAVTIERETTGMGLAEPEVEFLFRPGAKDPQRNDPTVSPLGPMNNIE